MIDADQLHHWVNQPETHRKIVGSYQGGYALGVTDDPPAFTLRVETSDLSRFPDSVTVQGTEVPVVVHPGFRPPRPQSSHRST